MSKLLRLTIFILLLSLTNAFSQNAIVKGTIKAEDIKTLEITKATLYTKESIVAAEVMVDSLGVFAMSVNIGTYSLTLQRFGQEILRKDINVDKHTDLGLIQVDTVNKLEEVVIDSYRKLIRREVDRFVFDVGKSAQAIGGSAKDVLKVTPGVSIMGEDISIIGKEGIQIMINNRLTTIPRGGLSNFLSSIAAEDIKSIEVITTPPAQFDSEGNYGLINIIYKKRSNSWNSRIQGNYVQTTFPAYAAGGNFAYQKDNFSLTVDLNGKKGSEGVTEKSMIQYPSQYWDGKMKRKDQKDFLSARILVQYEASKRVTIGGQYIGGLENPNIRDRSVIKIDSQLQSTDSLIISKGNNNRDNYSHAVNLYSVIKLDTIGRSVSFDFDYLKYNEDQNRDFQTQTFLPDYTPGVDFTISNNTSSQDVNNYSFKTDVVHPLKDFLLNYGAKISFINNDNAVAFTDFTSGLPIFDPSQSDTFEYRENTQSVYFTASHKLSNNKWQFKAGLRFENTETEGISKTLGQKNKNNYNKLFPTFYTTFSPNDNNTYSFSYSKRIQRPKFWELNPFRWYVNDYYFAEGNPFLQPSFTDNFEFNHIYKGNLTTIAFASITDNGFGQMPLVDSETNIVRLTRQNYFTKYNYGVGIVYQVTKPTWFNSFIHTQLYYTDTKFNNGVDPSLAGREQNGFTYSINNNNTFIFNTKKTYLGEIGLWYTSPSNTGLNRQSNKYAVNIGVRTLFMDNRLQFSVNIYDIFRTSNPDITTYYNDDIVRTANVYPDNRYFKISASYSFGNQKIRSVKKDIGNSEEKNRLQ